MLLGIKSILNPVSCCNLEHSTAESIWAKIDINGYPHYFCSFCRPPQQPINDIQHLRKQLKFITNAHSSANPPAIHIMGDFNLCKIEWKNYLNTDGNELSHSDGLALIDIMQDYYMVQFVYFPTQGPNTLDLIISNLPGLVTDCFSPGSSVITIQLHVL